MQAYSSYRLFLLWGKLLIFCAQSFSRLLAYLLWVQEGDWYFLSKHSEGFCDFFPFIPEDTTPFSVYIMQNIFRDGNILDGVGFYIDTSSPYTFPFFI